ncbi:MAG: DUF1840 domain-containing protein [Burkholderiaceae bacterium]|nr:DUF1840 domain-containing protein [Burkholderiaceae bacterium]
MLYRFKSQATGDVVMFEINARQLLDIIGKAPDKQGIITVAQMPAAIAALEAAVKEETQARKLLPPGSALAVSTPGSQEDDDPQAERERVALFQRAAPLIGMLKRALAEKRDVVWGV